jgi:hypothetical protein
VGVNLEPDRLTRPLAADTGPVRGVASAPSFEIFRAGAGFLKRGLGRLLQPSGGANGGLGGWLSGLRQAVVVRLVLVGSWYG